MASSKQRYLLMSDIDGHVRGEEKLLIGIVKELKLVSDEYRFILSHNPCSFGVDEFCLIPPYEVLSESSRTR
jgi:hypothetical protein